MRNLVFSACLLLLGSLPAGLSAAHPDNHDIERVLTRHQLPAEALSVITVPLQPGLQGSAFNADKAVNPASVMKLVTTYAALDTLGPTYTWKTDLLTDGKVSGDTLHGNLYFRSGGDPKLTTERLWLLLRDLKLQGIQHIRGNLVLDGSHYDIKHLIAFDGEASDLYRPFMVEPDSLLVNFNAQRFIVRTDNGRAVVVSDPLVPEVQINNSVQVVASGACHTQTRVNFQPRRGDGNLALNVSGSLPEGCQSERYFAFIEHDRYTAGVIRSTWADMGGTLSGTTQTGTTPRGARLLSRLPSASVSDIIRDINKFSNNTLAKQLFVTLGGHFRAPGDADDLVAARRSLANWWQAFGGSDSQLVIENGSGLSRQERLSARGLARMLQQAASSPYAAEFKSSLPIVGVDGTMRRRLAKHPVAGQARVKTGTLKNVRAIAGYSKDKNGNDWVVVIIANYPRNLNNAILDDLLASLYSQQPVR